uniref:Conserved hypothetical plastid protein n=1 Tax=Bangiopsis subsimplex TaxID=139980 RepID=A0A1C9CCI3_9RHOD|nr:hypothetical protein Bangp_014 [Bangiopsis subsimplex]AOM66096.1 hypothetical protein Bangp_014 [Bangiopsis subsimplex]ARO90347.1 conserved hypothetical plastid protein [Bangiopsis subsimplex]
MESWPLSSGIYLTNIVASVFAKTKIKLLNNLNNKTTRIIPIDILTLNKKYFLLLTVVKELEKIVIKEIDIDNLTKRKKDLTRYIIRNSTEKFLFDSSLLNPNYIKNMRYSTLVNFDTTATHNLENSLEILMSFFLYGSGNKIRMTFNPIFGNKIPVAQVEILLDNFIIQIANCIIDAILRSSHGIKFAFQYLIFDPTNNSIRKIEHFRNNLMWYKFIDQYVTIPKNIYENKYSLWIVSPKGLFMKNISAYRLQELSNLSTSQLIITFLLEIQDFLLPKIYTLVQFFFKIICYIIYYPLRNRIRNAWKIFLNDFS